MNIYSPKFMVESATSFEDKVLGKSVAETYLFSTLDALREMNEVIDRKTKKLYVQIAEAESKEDENKLMADYFHQFKKIFADFSNKVREMQSRMIVSVENKMDTWSELTKDDSYIVSFDKEFTYSGWEFLHINDSDYPRMDLKKIYQKEFDYIGQLMQDSKSSLSSNAKLKIIAAVSNNFANCSGDKNWINDLIKFMVDEDEKEIANSYSETIYNSLRNKYDYNVNKGVLYSCKEKLTDYEDAIDAAVKLCNDLLDDLDFVAGNIASYLFRNNDKKLSIKTDSDGVIDRDYRLDTYSMNQLNIFMKSKVNQMRKVLNVYATAIGIKFDTVVDYIDQNINILNMAKEYHNNSTPDDIESSLDTDQTGISDEDIDTQDASDSQSDDIEDPSTDDDAPASGAEPDLDSEPISEEEPPVEPEVEEPQVEENSAEPEHDDALDTEGNGDFNESYFFESDLFIIEMEQNAANLYSYVREALLHEEDQPAAPEQNGQEGEGENSGNPQSDQNNMSGVQKIADNSNVWQKIVEKIIALWNKFREAVFERSKGKIEYLKKNSKYISNKLDGGKITLAYTPDIDTLKKITIPDFNYQAMKQYLTSEDEFKKQYFGNLGLDAEKSISDGIKTKVLGEEQSGKPSELSIGINDAYNFCIEYQNNVGPIKKQADLIQKAQRVAKNVTKVQESSMNGLDQYFSEMKAEGFKDSKQAAANGDKSSQVAIYFKVVSQVVAAEMTCYSKLFNELYNYCKWWITTSGGPAPKIVEKKEG